MKLTAFVTIALWLPIPGNAAAAEMGGSGALALAAMVGELSPQLTEADRETLVNLFDGNASSPSPNTGKLAVAASEIQCRTSTVDLTAHECTLAFDGKDRTLAGRAAHELLATLAEQNIRPDAGAGNVWYALTGLKCEIDVDRVKSKDGGGVSCSFSPGG